MSGYQEITIELRSSHLKTLQEIAQKELGSVNEIEKLIFTALLDYFEARTTNQILEEAIGEGLQVLEEHMGVLLDLIKTLLISSSYDTTKIRLLLEHQFEKEIGNELIPELYARTGESVIERLKEEDLENTAQIITEIEKLKRELSDQTNKDALQDKKKEEEQMKLKNREKEYAITLQRLTEKASQSEQQQKKIAVWTNGLLNYLTHNQGDPSRLIEAYISKNPKPEGIL